MRSEIVGLWPYLMPVVVVAEWSYQWRHKDRIAAKGMLSHLTTALAAGTFLWLILITLPWSRFGNAGYAAVLLALALYAVRTGTYVVHSWRLGYGLGAQWPSPTDVRNLLIAVFCLALAMSSIAAPRPFLVLRSPLEGRWSADNGGGTLAVNLHHRIPEQRYALDIVRIGSDGRSWHGSRADLAAYHAWDQPVYAPASGVVRAAVDGCPDNRPPARDRRELRGNHVLIELADQTRIILAHLKLGSVIPRAGEQVREGQLVGHVGNSGNTTEPHLHVGVTRKRRGRDVGIPFCFDDEGRVACLRRGQTSRVDAGALRISRGVVNLFHLYACTFPSSGGDEL